MRASSLQRISVPISFCLRRAQATRNLVAAFAMIILGLSGSARADMASVNMSVWKMKYGVTDAQASNPAWLAADDDGDGIKNGDELAAGTNPFSAGSVIKIASITSDTTNVYITFPTEYGKQYVAQGAVSLANAFTGTGVTWNGTGGNKTLTVPMGTNKFFRVLVQDMDTDGDGVSDWAEKIAGYDPTKAMTDGRTADGTALSAGLTAMNQVSVIATKSSATQPAGTDAAVDVGSVTIARGIAKLGSLSAPDITVTLQKLGTATEGSDYDGLPASVTFTGSNVSQQVLTVNPKANSSRRTNVTAIVKAVGGVNYTVGTAGSASVVINPAGVTDGTGLTGNYFNTSSSTYSANQTIFAGTPKMTRIDPVIDFANSIVSISTGNPCTVTTARPHEIATTATVRISGVPSGTFSPTINTTYTATSTGANTFTVPVNCTVAPASIAGSIVGGTNGWDSATGPVGMSSLAAGGAWSVRWTGQVLPQYSETYTFDIKSDDSAKVWVNGVLLIDRWTTQGATDYVNTIDLKAGTLYDIQIDYWNSSGSAEARLYWWSPSQVKQIIPQTRLFPAPATSAKFTAITSSLSAVGYVGVPFSFSVTTPDISAATTYALASGSGPLPAGLSLNVNTGVISGTPTAAGAYNVAINATNLAAGTVTGSSIIDITIFPSGSVSREILAGSTVTKETDVSTLDDNTHYPNNTSRRLRGYIVPPKTGNYYFWLAANNTAEFWLSNDSEYVNKVRRASVTASTGNKAWNAQASQQSQWLALVAGQKYYFEVLHNTGTDTDHYVSLGWCQDDVGTVVAVAGAPNATGAKPLIATGGAARQGYPYSGVTPSYLFQPYDYPTVAASSGVLYAANLGPQGSSTTKASGSANLRVDFAGNSAVLHFNFSGLSSPRTGYHLHTDGFDTHPAGAIVFDIDDIDAFHPELRTADGGYIWNFTTVGTFTSVQQIKDAISLGKIYLNIHSVASPNGEIRGNLTFVNGSQNPPDPTAYIEPAASDVSTDYANAARFLNQATFGASPTDVAYVQANGFSGWINDQLTKTPSRSSNDVVAGLTSDINQPYPSSLFTNAWWKYSITGQDQLRQRLAFALSEIMVVSWNNDSGPLAFNGRILADYYDNLLDYCLPVAGLTDSGNFRGILKQVTLTPAMGLYLDMRANQKGDDSLGRHPNENYGREVMQLFSVGLNRMWDDGKFVVDSNANLVPTYNQNSILGMAALLTGWNYAQALQASGRLPSNFGPAADYLNPMVLVPTQHENRYAKFLLNRVVSPAATGFTPRVNISSISTGTQACTVNTSTPHGLKTGDTITIAGVTSGTFTGGLTAINAAFQATVTSGTAFTVPVVCTAAAGAVGTVTGATVLPQNNGSLTGVTSGGIAPVSSSQADNAGSTVPHPYDQYGLNELDLAVDNIVNNDNVPPYICRQLIQRLVTSNPSPGYIYRVVQKFKDNGSGVRGDMAAVVKQILLDGEARSTSAAYSNNIFGKQREPMLRVTAPARAFTSVPYTGTYTQLTGINSNKLRIVTSVANAFSPGFSFALNFQGNYTSTVPPTPYTNPTSTTYSVASTLGIASTYTDIASIATGNPTVIATSQPHGLQIGSTAPVTISGVSGNFASTINTTLTATIIDATTFSVPVNTTLSFQVASISTGNPCTVTTVAPHGLPAGTTAGLTINGINGGSFAGTINGTTLSVINTGANTFTVTGVACTLAPTSITTWRHVSNPCRVTTTGPHGLNTGDTITIGSVSGGSFTPSINNTFSVTVIDPTSFTVPVSCTAPSTINTGSIVGGNTLDVTCTGMINVTYSQLAGSNVMTVNTTGPQTDVAVPNPNSATTTLKSRVYLNAVTVGSSVAISGISTGSPCTVTTAQNHGLTTGNTVTIASVSGGTFAPPINNTYTITVTGINTFTVPSNCTVIPTANTGTISGSWISMPAIGVYDVQANPTGSTFTVITADTPAGPRSGNVIIPKISTSYTPISSNNVVQYNCNVNHNMQVGNHVWVDVPIVGSPVTDAEYVITAPITGSGIAAADEAHFQTSYLPVTSSLSTTFPKPSGSNNGITLWPLVAPPIVRSGNVTINQSTFVIGSTESSLSQSPLNAPTVFNYFFPNYKFPGTLSNNGIDSPEFQLSTDTNLSNLTNSMTNMIIGTGGGNGNVNGLSSFNNGSGSIVMDIGGYLGSASDAAIPGLIDTLAKLLVGAPLEANTKNTIQNFVTYRQVITNISQASPCVVTTSLPHGLVTGNQIVINDATGGSFSGGTTAINNNFIVTVTGASTFTIGTVASPSIAVNCTNNTTISYTNANVSYFPMNIPNPGPTNLQKRDRVRAIIQLILTSAEFAVQK